MVSKDKKRLFITVYLKNEQEKKEIEERARELGVSVSTYIKLKALGRIS